MANSPSISLIERDSSSYTVTTSETVLAIVGYASNGRFDKPQLVTSRNDFIKKYGNPPESAPWSHLAAYRAFNQSNQIIFWRVGDTESGDSDEAFQAERVITHLSRNGRGGGDSGDSVKVIVRSKYTGSYNNDLSFKTSFELDPITGDSIHKVEILKNAIVQEIFEDVTWSSGDSNFFETLINRSEDNGGSKLVVVDKYHGSGDSIFDISGDSAGETYLIGDSDGADSLVFATLEGDTWTSTSGDSADYHFRQGTDGVPTGDTIGASLFAVVLGTGEELANTELYDFHILITPDSSNQVTQNAAVTLAADRGDFIYIADPPQSTSQANVVSWHNGTGDVGRDTALNSSYVATYWPWLKDWNTNTGQYAWCPPSVFIAEKYLETDRLYGPWFACAGDIRGRIVASDYETSPSKSQRDSLYGGLNAVNPIVFFNQKGLEIYGQKTTLRNLSALNRVNIRRMIIFVKKLIKRAMDGIVFEPHTADSWTRATNIINSILEPVRQGGGLDDYRVIIDANTNTPSLIAQGTMKGIVKLLPVGTIEIIELSIQLFSPGSSIE
ncbi:hypothetical protein CL621_01490 [archaeon]|nr:hypothetical protein [archaeon]|tara:strand:- start:3258 stop:4922 length:1665 start_codon:yes stop_codon:yes gene_type:complete